MWVGIENNNGPVLGCDHPPWAGLCQACAHLRRATDWDCFGLCRVCTWHPIGLLQPLHDGRQVSVIPTLFIYCIPRVNGWWGMQLILGAHLPPTSSAFSFYYRAMHDTKQIYKLLKSMQRLTLVRKDNCRKRLMLFYIELCLRRDNLRTAWCV